MRAAGVRSAVAILQAAKKEIELSGGVPDGDAQRALGNAIFIVHGHDNARREGVARLLARLTKNDPVILHEQPNQGRTLIEKFEQHAADAAYAVIIATGDDLGRAAGSDDDRPRARQNVILEMGFFFGVLGRGRVAVLYEPGVELPSAIDGIVYIKLDAGDGWRLKLAQELKASGLGVDMNALI